MGKLFKIALGLFLVGVGILAIFSLMSEDRIFAFANDEDYVYHELSYDADDFAKLSFNFENRDFLFRKSDNDEIKITYYTTEKDPVEVTEVGTTLKLVNEIVWYNQVFIGWNFFTNDDYYDVYVYLPDSVDYEIYLIDSNGSVDITGVTNLTDVFVTTSNGRITTDSAYADSMDLISSNGEIRVTGTVVADSLTVATSNGRIYLTDVVAETIIGSTSNGKVVGTNVACESITLNTSNGDIEIGLAGEKNDYDVIMSTSNGDMVYDGLETSQEYIYTPGEFIIILNTSNGDIVITFGE